VLYEMMTGRPPFRGAQVMETLDQVRTADPVPPRRLNPAMPRDLETICLKCLHKEPRRRYASAADLADDLKRFLSRVPVLARPVGRTERVWRWCRRNPGVAALSVTVLLLIVAGLISLTALYLNAESEREQAEIERRRADEQRDRAR